MDSSIPSLMRNWNVTFGILVWLGVFLASCEPSCQAEEAYRDLPLIKEGKLNPDWVQVGWGGFSVVDNALRTECVDEGMGLLLYQSEQFGNCQIRVVYRTEHARSNAGVFVRVDPGILAKRDEKPPPIRRNRDGSLAEGALEQLMASSEKELGPWYAVHHGFEIQICDGAEPFNRTGSVYSLAKAEPLPKAANDHWRTMIISLRGTEVLVEIDGKKVTHFDSDRGDVPADRQWYEPKREPKRPTSGYIGLQNHDPGDVVYFKEVKVRPLPDSSKQ